VQKRGKRQSIKGEMPSRRGRGEEIQKKKKAPSSGAMLEELGEKQPQNQSHGQKTRVDEVGLSRRTQGNAGGLSEKFRGAE